MRAGNPYHLRTVGTKTYYGNGTTSSGINTTAAMQPVFTTYPTYAGYAIGSLNGLLFIKHAALEMTGDFTLIAWVFATTTTNGPRRRRTTGSVRRPCSPPSASGATAQRVSSRARTTWPATPSIAPGSVAGFFFVP